MMNDITNEIQQGKGVGWFQDQDQIVLLLALYHYSLLYGKGSSDRSLSVQVFLNIVIQSNYKVQWIRFSPGSKLLFAPTLMVISRSDKQTTILRIGEYRVHCTFVLDRNYIVRYIGSDKISIVFAYDRLGFHKILNSEKREKFTKVLKTKVLLKILPLLFELENYPIQRIVHIKQMMDMETRYVAAMVLSGVGDALGYKNGSWEFCYSGELIHKEAEMLGGIENIEVSLPGWRVSDDTVMHLALAQALATNTVGEDKEGLYSRIAHHFKLGMHDMYGRMPGPTTTSGCRLLKPEVQKGYCTPFNPRGQSCGAAMRSMCMGLRYPRPEEIDDLVAVSIEAGRMTHHHPTGYLGSLASALFTSYAIQGKPLKVWGWSLVHEVLPKAKDYIITHKEYVKENIDNWDYFRNRWIEYLDTRCLSDGESEPIFPTKYGVKERDDFYHSLSFDDGWGGASGHDAPMIAYDALLSSNGDWKELCSRAMFHSGDSDSTGVIAACCYGAMKGFEGVPECNYKHLEYGKELKEAAVKIYALSHPDCIKRDS